MNTRRKLQLILFTFFVVLTSKLLAQDLSQLSANDRNEKLIEVAKAVYSAPRLRNFYREYGTPTITESKTIEVPSSEYNRIYNDPNSIWYGGRNSQKYYVVYFSYDMNKERFDEAYAAKVYIWEDTGAAFAIGLGNKMMLPVRDGKVPNYNQAAEPIKYYNITYSKDVPNVAILSKSGKYGDLVTIELKTVITETYDGWTTEQGYNFDPKKDLINGEVVSDLGKYIQNNIHVRTVQLMVTGDMIVNITRYQEEYESPY